MKYKEKHMEKQGMGTYSREREAYLDQIDHQRRRRKHHVNISRYESHRYAFEIHQYTQVIHP